jgi:uncharacterized protein
MGISKSLILAIRDQYVLDWEGTHGIRHWQRVRENGIRIAHSSGADVGVVELFALLHDACRVSEASDPGHGRRGAELARHLRGELIDLEDVDFELLCEACAHHTDGQRSTDRTLGTCWDADRLDLGRVGIRPEPRFMSTEAARQRSTIEWAYGRSREGRRRR